MLASLKRSSENTTGQEEMKDLKNYLELKNRLELLKDKIIELERRIREFGGTGRPADWLENDGPSDHASNRAGVEET